MVSYAMLLVGGLNFIFSVAKSPVISSSLVENFLDSAVLVNLINYPTGGASFRNYEIK